MESELSEVHPSGSGSRGSNCGVKNKKSGVWKFFQKTARGGKCSICLNDVKTGGNTTNLSNHLKRKHPLVTNESGPGVPGPTGRNEIKKIKQSVSFSQDEFEGEPSNSHQSGTDGDSDTETNDIDSEKSEESSMSSFTAKTQNVQKQNGMVKIDSTIRNLVSYKEGEKASKITNAILFMIAKDNLTLNHTDKEGFKYFMKTAVPLYKIPGRTKVTQLLDEKYELLSTIVKNKLQTVEHMSLTTDVWTETMNTQSFLGITIHYIFDKKLTNTCLGVYELEEKHTSDYLTEKLRFALAQWRIPEEKIVCAITDNGANMVKCITNIFGRSKHLPCFAHTLNLVATKVIESEEIKRILNLVKAIVTFFKHSVAASDALRKYQSNNEYSKLKLIQSVPTRWNSTYYMLDRFITLSEAVGAILLKFPNSPNMLSAVELQIAKEMIEVLKPIEAVTKEICSEQFVTSSKMIPIVNCLRKNISQLQLTTTIGLDLLNLTINELTRRFSEIELVNVLAISTYLDPRFKKLHFQNHQAVANVHLKINNLLKIPNNSNSNHPPSSPNSVKQYPEVKNNSFWSVHFDLVNQVEHNPTEFLEMNEFRQYTAQPVIHFDEDPIKYWSDNALVFKHLSKIALKHLVIVATSVPSERLFSKTGNIMQETRNRLKGERLSKLLFLNSLDLNDWHLH